MICKNCGADNSETSKFCIKCGNPMDSVDETEVMGAEMEHLEAAECSCGCKDSEPEKTDRKPVKPISVQKTCQKCGALLGENQEFCHVCGTKFGNASSGEGVGVHFENIMDLVKTSFKAPLGTVKRAADEKYTGAALFIFLIKDLIFSILATLDIKSSLYGVFGNTLFGIQYWNGFAVFMYLFLMFVLIDAVVVFVPYGMGRAFGSKLDVKKWIGATGAISIIPIIVTFFAIIIGFGSASFASILVGLCSVFFYIIFLKSFDVLMGISEDKNVYAMFVAAIVTVIAVGIVIGILTASFMPSFGSLGGYGNLLGGF